VDHLDVVHWEVANMHMTPLGRHFVHGLVVVLHLESELPIYIVHQELFGALHAAAAAAVAAGVDDTVSLHNHTVMAAVQYLRIQFVQREGPEFVYEFGFVVVGFYIHLLLLLVHHLAGRIVDVAQG
jgi:hypothetical protein